MENETIVKRDERKEFLFLPTIFSVSKRDTKEKIKGGRRETKREEKRLPGYLHEEIEGQTEGLELGNEDLDRTERAKI